MPELAVGYIKLTSDASSIPREINAALKGVDAQASAAGKSMGGRMSSALGTALKAGAASVAAAGVATIGTAMVKGFQRLSAIDDAKAKLSGLGNSAADVSKIMDNALASVRGTAFGMGDAAGLAGTMVAAGVKPGRELESVLKRVADSAAIAGTDLSDMGQIWGKVYAKGKVDGEIINQMLERQIPIYDILGKKMGKNAEEIADMVSNGKISAQDFSDAMNDKIGGSATKMGNTVSGAFKNLSAALGRLGASALEPFFNRAGGGLGNITDLLDKLEPKVKALSQAFSDKVFTEWGPKLKTALQAARDSGSLDQLLVTLRGMAQAGINVAPALADIGKALAQSAAVIGVGTWQLFLTALQATAQTLNVVAPLLSTLGDLMQQHPALVTAAVAAWGLFKTVPSILGRVTSATTPLVASLSSARVSVRDFGAAYQTSLGYMRQANPQISTAGAHLGVLQGNATAAGRAMSQSLGGGVNRLVGALGGPMSAALVGAGALFMMVSSENQKAAQSAEAYSNAIDRSREAQVQLNAALRESRGAIDDNVMSMQAQTLTAYMDELTAATGKTGSSLDRFRAEGESLFSMHSILGGYTRTQAQAYKEMGEEAQGSIDAIKGLGLSTEELAKQVYGSQSGFDALSARLRASGEDGAAAARRLAQMRSEFQKQKGVAASVTPGIKEVAEAMETLGDKSATAADKLKAIKTAMDALNPARSKAEAVRQMGEAIRSAAEAAAGIGPGAFDASGALDAMSESGGKLADTLSNLAEKQAQVASTGDAKAIARTNKEIEATLQSLADATGQPIEKIRELYASFGGGENIDLMVRLSGASDVTQQIGSIVAKMNAVPGVKTVEIESGVLSDKTLKVLDDIGIKTKTLPSGNVKVDVTGDAAKKLQEVINTANRVPGGKAVVTTAPGGQAVYDMLHAMGVEVRINNDKTISTDIPNGSPVLQLLRDIGYEVQTRNGKTIIVKADDTDYRNKKLEWTKDEYKRIIAQGVNFGETAPGGGVFRGPGIAYNADGGITVDSFANGGLKEIRKPRRADIYQGRGAGTIFAEEETGGEAYIPLAASKRGRSTSILSEVANRFGLGLVAKRADGAVVTAEDLRRLADGEGAAQPLKGAPYVWGGINWGDCSGAMAAFARRAVGLDPFGGRFATSSMGGQLAQMGFTNGSWSQGLLGFGWVNGGPGGGHTAGTLPDGTNVEMGGAYGGGMVGGNVGANSGQFTHRMVLPVAAGAKIDPYERPGDEYSADPNYRPGQQGGGATAAEQPKGASLSERLGNAASAAVSGQVQSLLGVLGANDSPGFLAAINEYESQRSQSRQSRQQSAPTPTPTPADPGTSTPKEGEDTGQTSATPTGLDAIKMAFKEGLRILWRTGPEWDATDYIVNKESGWKVDARNPESGAFGLGQWLGTTKDKYLPDESTDPTVQGRAFDAYVSDRYSLPTKAKQFWDANNWYDAGGIASAKGLMLKGVNTPERVLSPRQTAAFEEMVKREFQSGIGNDQIVARLDRMISLLESDDRGGDTFNWNSSGNSKTDVDEVKRARRVAKLARV